MKNNMLAMPRNTRSQMEKFAMPYEEVKADIRMHD